MTKKSRSTKMEKIQINQENQHPRSINGSPANKKVKKESNETKFDNPDIEQERNLAQINAFEMMPTLIVNNQQQSISQISSVQPIQSEQIVQNQSQQVIEVQKSKKRTSKLDYQTNNQNSFPSMEKKKMITKKSLSQPSSVSTQRRTKPLTAKDSFKLKHKQMKKQQIDQIWKALPKQSKNFWKGQGQADGFNNKLSEVSSVKSSKKSTYTYNKMKALLNQN